VSGDGVQVTKSFRDVVEATYPEAVARRRAEELKALATSELHQLVPGGEPYPALVQVSRELLRPRRLPFTPAGVLGAEGARWDRSLQG